MGWKMTGLHLCAGDCERRFEERSRIQRKNDYSGRGTSTQKVVRSSQGADERMRLWKGVGLVEIERPEQQGGEGTSGGGAGPAPKPLVLQPEFFFLSHQGTQRSFSHPHPQGHDCSQWAHPTAVTKDPMCSRWCRDEMVETGSMGDLMEQSPYRLMGTHRMSKK